MVKLGVVGESDFRICCIILNTFSTITGHTERESVTHAQQKPSLKTVSEAIETLSSISKTLNELF